MEYLPFTNMYPKTYPTVGKYSLHEAYGCICDTSEEKHSRKRTKKQNVQLSKLCCHWLKVLFQASDFDRASDPT
jgi:hypothetical protein